MLRFFIACAAIASAIFFSAAEAASASKRHVLFPHGKTAASGAEPLVVGRVVTSSFDDGRSSDERSTQHLTNVRRMLAATTSKPGRNSLNQYFRSITAIYRRQGYGKIASSLKKSLLVLLEIGTAESAADVNRSRARRAIRKVLSTSLTLQSIVSPSEADPIVPVYTALAASYGTQLQTAYQNLRKDRRLTKGFGKTPSAMWLGSPGNFLGGSPVQPINLGSGLSYNVTLTGGGYASGATMLYGFVSTQAVGNLTVIPFAGTLIALPEGSPAPNGAITQITPSAVSSSILMIGTIEYDLTLIPSDSPHRIYGLPEGTDIPDGAIVLAPIADPPTPDSSPTPEP